MRTERLLLRRWQAADREPFAALNTEPEVMAHLGGRALTREESDALVGRFEAGWARHGHGLYVAAAGVEGPWGRAGTHLGFVGLNHHRTFPDEVEIGWRLTTRAWGHGLATEGALAVRDLADARLDVRRLISVTVAENIRTRRVMAKLGFTPWREEVAWEGLRLIVYARACPSHTFGAPGT